MNTVEEIKTNIEHTTEIIKDTLKLLEYGNEIAKEETPEISRLIEEGESTTFNVVHVMIKLYGSKLTTKELQYSNKYMSMMASSKEAMKRFKCMVLLHKLLRRHLNEDELVNTMLAQICLQDTDDTKETKTEMKAHETSHIPKNAHAPAVRAPNNYTCFCCGEHGHKKTKCPHKHERCENCNKMGHLAATCWKRPKKRCYCCGSTSHLKERCALKFSNCGHCGMKGHTEPTCRRTHKKPDTAPSAPSGVEALANVIIDLIFVVIENLEVLPKARTMGPIAKEEIAEKVRGVLRRSYALRAAWDEAKTPRRPETGAKSNRTRSKKREKPQRLKHGPSFR